ncbi:hypothetical protein SBA2_550008 [Acidobacteriia bacterium SbA2]|nr:hypothetical protein SBA2_550008 [Acidobacteriia bacterium SbA2]
MDLLLSIIATPVVHGKADRQVLPAGEQIE